jgi:uncharacterized protein YjiK
MIKISQTLILLIMTVGCADQNSNYKLDQPSRSMQLTEQLDEISGLVMLSDSLIGVVQDENGIIYYVASESGKIVDQFEFGKDGDYEGVTFHQGDFYVLKSNGSIVQTSRDGKSVEYNFKNSKGFDFEGICADPKNNRLLVACKEHGNKDKRDHIYIYSFGLENKKYYKKAAFKIKKELVHQNFKPSGIAIHPNENIYVLSSFSKTLLVLAPDGEIKSRSQFGEFICQQPEGITFNSKGDLLISNEQKETTANILVFKLKH